MGMRTVRVNLVDFLLSIFLHDDTMNLLRGIFFWFLVMGRL
jgi:hypothetical protein